jgi:chromosome segregation ATPase
MRHLAPALVAALLLAVPCAAGEDLAAAGKANKEKRKKSTTRVITNEDVVKARGNITETKGGTPQEELPPPESLIEKHQVRRAERAIAEHRLHQLESRLAALEKELTLLEQQYFEESDLTRRDTVIAKRFDEVKESLDGAREELESLERPE